ncbi:MAG: hypothetical protein H7Y30_12535 [Pyrinomonadaceae bacterium]|nr:hypothetical protein [Pyrinomonadaceae bacterium]
MITISHDRYFVHRVATQILALDGASNAEQYSGDYTEYHDWKAAQRFSQPASTGNQPTEGASVAPKKASPAFVEREASRQAQAANGKGAKKKKEATRGPQAVEAEIAEIEKRLAALSEEMGRSEVVRAPERLAQPNEEYRQADELLRALYEEWERVAAEATNA